MQPQIHPCIEEAIVVECLAWARVFQAKRDGFIHDIIYRYYSLPKKIKLFPSEVTNPVANSFSSLYNEAIVVEGSIRAESFQMPVDGSIHNIIKEGISFYPKNSNFFPLA